MRWIARLTGLILAAGGVGAAHALVPAGQAQEPPPTEPAPTEPAQTVTEPATLTPTPTPPPVRLAPEPKPAPPPATVEITVPADEPPTQAPTPAPRALAPPSRPYVAPAPEPRVTPSTVGRTGRPVARPKAFEATRHRTASRVSVRFAVRIPRSGRAFLIVRGPAPSCRVAGYVPLRGKRGATTVFFSGRVHGRRLGPGVYRISLSPNRRLVAGAPTEFVRVTSARRSAPLPESAARPACSRASPAATPPAKKVPPVARVASATKKPVSAEADDTAAAALPVGDVLGEATEESDTGPFLAIAVLALVAGLLLAMVALVTKFLRGSWNP